MQILSTMDNYNTLIQQVAIYLKSQKFKKKSSTFYLIESDNLGLINFQKSNSSTTSKVLFTINLGISSSTIRAFESEDVTQIPSVWDCHWQKRIGQLLQKNDFWWTIDEYTSLDNLLSEIINIVSRIAIPNLKNRLSDDALIKMWVEAYDSQTIKSVDFFNLLILLKIHNKENLQIMVEQFKIFHSVQKMEPTAKRLLKRLGFE